MYEGWLSSFQFKWTPIITYTRRHLGLLDWLEKNVEPVAFVDSPEKHTLGVALLAPDLRLTVGRSGLLLESGMSGLDVDRLAPAIEGVFEVMDPSSVLATEYRETGVVALAGADYYEECAKFGRLVGGGAFKPGSDYRVTDGSAVLDLESDRFKVQAEWGIVRSDELLSRLRTPEASRLRGGPARTESARIARSTPPGRELPEVSVYADQIGFWRSGGGVEDCAEVLKQVSVARQAARTIATDLADAFLDDLREAR
ncbi:hypothetical protein [Prescottella agglutinans]|uniref:Uncharacterized protein n=1 Tax=Prescottella agglutinans TaxID=1644129 RepID=A0ABT6M5H0_9NOCA|nr:hypothetical protein [Prescottella agglutinans]MDH6279552.1 hypothetical protein [Prescottella agglutinans]